MITCLIVSAKPFLFDAIASIDNFTSQLTLTQAIEFKPGFDLVITDTKLKTKAYAIEFLDRPILLSDAILEIETYINSYSKQLHLADTTVDVIARRLICADASVALTEIECKIISSLITSSNHSIPRDEIKTSVLGYKKEVQTSTIENHIYHLRQKLASCGCALSIERVGDEYRLVY